LPACSGFLSEDAWKGIKKMNKTWNLKEMKKLIPLALPVLVVNLSIVGMGAVDAIVAGRAGVTDMAAWGLPCTCPWLSSPAAC
jgi:Na+-driven multidrug efflux pump